MNPRTFCRERTFHQALVLTYSFDPVFFEQIVLPDLWAGRTSDILVLGDGREVSSAVQEAVGRLWHLGKRYVLGNAAHAGSFHPKLLLRIGPTEGAVMIGSGNVTSCGWGGNKELACGWVFGPKLADTGAWLPRFLDEVISWCSSDLGRDAAVGSPPDPRRSGRHAGPGARRDTARPRLTGCARAVTSGGRRPRRDARGRLRSRRASPSVIARRAAPRARGP